MNDSFHWIETTIRYLTTEEGGRRSSVRSGYRGQFYYEGQDYDGFQYFPDFGDDEFISLGTTVRALIQFGQQRWIEVHANRIQVGMAFEIREGSKVVGRGAVTSVKADGYKGQKP